MFTNCGQVGFSMSPPSLRPRPLLVACWLKFNVKGRKETCLCRGLTGCHIIYPFRKTPQRKECYYYYFTEEDFEAQSRKSATVPAHRGQPWDPLPGPPGWEIAFLPLTSSSPSTQKCLLLTSAPFSGLDASAWAALLGSATERVLWSMPVLRRTAPWLKNKDEEPNLWSRSWVQILLSCWLAVRSQTIGEITLSLSFCLLQHGGRISSFLSLLWEIQMYMFITYSLSLEQWLEYSQCPVNVRHC